MSRYLQPNYYKRKIQKENELIQSDLVFLSNFGNRGGKLHSWDKKSVETKYLKVFRKFQANRENVWGLFYKKILNRYNKKYGMDFGCCPNFGQGIIIGHWGRIVINPETKFGDHIFLTHNVTIGRDVRGKREGVPTIGNRVCIRTNATVVGKITIGDDVLIAPNTFVNFDVPDHSIVVGNPASIHHRDNATAGHII